MVTAHFTRAQSKSMALLKNILVIMGIYRLTTWSSVHTFSWHCASIRAFRADTALLQFVLDSTPLPPTPSSGYHVGVTGNGAPIEATPLRRSGYLYSNWSSLSCFVLLGAPILPSFASKSRSLPGFHNGFALLLYMLLGWSRRMCSVQAWIADTATKNL